MIKRITALLLIIATLGASFSRLYVYAGFSLNQKYIAATLCENHDKPWLHCNGKCYFMKKIKQAEEKEKTDERQSQKSAYQEVFFSSADKVKFHTQLLQIISTPYNFPEQSALTETLFRPPQA